MAALTICVEVDDVKRLDIPLTLANRPKPLTARVRPARWRRGGTGGTVEDAPVVRAGSRVLHRWIVRANDVEPSVAIHIRHLQVLCGERWFLIVTDQNGGIAEAA